MFYEIELLNLYIQSLINAIETVDNKENITLDFVFNISEFFEKIDTDKITVEELEQRFKTEINKLKSFQGLNICSEIIKSNSIYTQTNYRREFNTNHSYISDILVWGETDSLLPKEAFSVWEKIRSYTESQGINKYIFSFADRKMWDNSWDQTVHKDFLNTVYDENVAMENPNMAKSQMSIEDMNIINEKTNEYEFITLNQPKVDGSFLTITSDLIRSGVNIPPCLIHNDDQSFSIMAQKLCGNNFLQIVCKNILKVHARRHPKKRLYVLDEDNPRGLCGDNNKGTWWKTYKSLSQQNINTLISNPMGKFLTEEDFNKKVKNKI